MQHKATLTDLMCRSDDKLSSTVPLISLDAVDGVKKKTVWELRQLMDNADGI